MTKICERQIDAQVKDRIVIEIHFKNDKVKESITLCNLHEDAMVRPLFFQYKSIAPTLLKELLDLAEYDEEWDGYQYEASTSLTYNEFMSRYYN